MHTITAQARPAADVPDRAPRRLSGFKPTGRLHLGNLLGAITPMVRAQGDADSIVMLADLHALTVAHDPAAVRELTAEQVTVLLAAGVDPARTAVYVQSHLSAHTSLHYLLECATGYGEATRMIQFRERAGSERDHVRLSLLSYPVLMAADILLHDTDVVPVGEDQAQHLELARTVSIRFNHRYGPVFTVPEAGVGSVAARVMDLTRPNAKMGKSNDRPAGTIRLLDPPDVVSAKLRRAVTDDRGVVCRDRQGQPGVTNLIEIVEACTGAPPAATDYRRLKDEAAEAVIDVLRPIQARHADIGADPLLVRQVLADGVARVRPRAEATLRRAEDAIGLLRP